MYITDFRTCELSFFDFMIYHRRRISWPMRPIGYYFHSNCRFTSLPKIEVIFSCLSLLFGMMRKCVLYFDLKLLNNQHIDKCEAISNAIAVHITRTYHSNCLFNILNMIDSRNVQRTSCSMRSVCARATISGMKNVQMVFRGNEFMCYDEISWII